MTRPTVRLALIAKGHRLRGRQNGTLRVAYSERAAHGIRATAAQSHAPCRCIARQQGTPRQPARTAIASQCDRREDLNPLINPRVSAAIAVVPLMHGRPRDA